MPNQLVSLTKGYALNSNIYYLAYYGLDAFFQRRPLSYRWKLSIRKTEVIPEKSGLIPGETTWFAVRQDVRDGWHVFWVNPGDAGLPLDFSWESPSGYEVGEILHPPPEYIPVGPLASYAHEGEPVFLVPVTCPGRCASGLYGSSIR